MIFSCVLLSFQILCWFRSPYKYPKHIHIIWCIFWRSSTFWDRQTRDIKAIRSRNLVPNKTNYYINIGIATAHKRLITRYITVIFIVLYSVYAIIFFLYNSCVSVYWVDTAEDIRESLIQKQAENGVFDVVW